MITNYQKKKKNIITMLFCFNVLISDGSLLALLGVTYLTSIKTFALDYYTHNKW